MKENRLFIELLNKKLAIANSKIEILSAQNLQRDKILSIVSHDLRSPISSLRGIICVLEIAGIDDEFRCEAIQLKRQLENVGEMLDKLLKWASLSFLNNCIESVVEIDIAATLQKNIDLISVVAKEKNIRITNDVHFQGRVTMNADKFDVIIRNLISNALKFTSEYGTISFTGRTTNRSVELTIADTGIGMTEQQLNNLFTPAHVSTYGTSGERGMGIGLLLCKEYIEAYKGTLSITSEVNAGTTIKITFPLNSNN